MANLSHLAISEVTPLHLDVLSAKPKLTKFEALMISEFPNSFYMTQLREISLYKGCKIPAQWYKRLINLTSLTILPPHGICLVHHYNVVLPALKHLPNLVKLSTLARGDTTPISQLVKLTSLTLLNAAITCKTLQRLTRLQELVLSCENTRENSHNLDLAPAFLKLTRLTSLNLYAFKDESYSINVKNLVNLTRLAALNEPVDIQGLSHLTKLSTLNIYGSSVLSNGFNLTDLPSLTCLYISKDTSISFQELFSLTKLTSLYCSRDYLSLCQRRFLNDNSKLRVELYELENYFDMVCLHIVLFYFIIMLTYLYFLNYFVEISEYFRSVQANNQTKDRVEIVSTP